MNQRTICKGLAVAVILLFIGLGVQPAIAVVEPEEDIIDVDPKDYLFQTIIDIANNPDVNNLLEQYNNDLFKVDIDRSVYRKLFLRNPRLFFNVFFTKPSLSVDYLNNCYNNGIEVTNIFGEDEVLEIIEKVEITDTKCFDELNDIIIEDKELSGRFAKLEEINNKANLDDTNILVGLICFVSLITFIVIGISIYPFAMVFDYFIKNSLISELIWSFTDLLLDIVLLPVAFLLIVFDCHDFFGFPDMMS
jgi:hypothetical protein